MKQRREDDFHKRKVKRNLMNRRGRPGAKRLVCLVCYVTRGWARIGPKACYMVTSLQNPNVIHWFRLR